MKKKISVLLVILVTILAMPVFALEENLTADNNVTLEKNIAATNFVAGNHVKTSSEIDGINFVAGNKVSISSKQDYLFAAGNSVYLKDIETKDAFVAGNDITIESSTIRDLYAAAETIEIASDISRNAYLAGNTIFINSKIEGDVVVAGEDIELGENAVITGTFKYPKEVKPVIHSKAEIGKKETYKSSDGVVEIDYNPSPYARIFSKMMSFLSLLLIALLLLLLRKDLYKKIDKTKKEGMEVLKLFGTGFLTLVAAPIMAIIVMITVIGIPLSVLTLMLYGVLIYLSAIPTAYYFGKWILKDKIKNDYLLLTVSLLAIFLVELIPVLGGLVGFISLTVGLGIYVNLLVKSVNQ